MVDSQKVDGPQVKDLQRRVNDIRWYHRINLASGITTNGVDNSEERLARLHLPPLDGRSVLDVGSWDGFFAFEAERRGASRVLATDSYSWHGDGWGSKAGFILAREALNSKVEDLDIDVMDLGPERVGLFDVVLFLGVLYHLKHPLLAIERVASVTRQCLVLETVVDLQHEPRPAMAFYPGTELNRDPTNWWAPNQACVVGMLAAAGFETVRTVTAPMSRSYRLMRSIYHQVRRQRVADRTYSRDRAVFHAFKAAAMDPK